MSKYAIVSKKIAGYPARIKYQLLLAMLIKFSCRIDRRAKSEILLSTSA